MGNLLDLLVRHAKALAIPPRRIESETKLRLGLIGNAVPVCDIGRSFAYGPARSWRSWGSMPWKAGLRRGLHGRGVETFLQTFNFDQKFLIGWKQSVAVLAVGGHLQLSSGVGAGSGVEID